MGFLNAGFDLVLAIDNDAAAVETYRRNLGSHGVQRDLSEELEVPACTVIIGGPPCQGFSSAGMRKSGDRRNSLVARFAEIVVRVRPLAFVFENVEGFLTAEGGARVFDLLAPLVSAGRWDEIRSRARAFLTLIRRARQAVVAGA